jgi:hypothetical protein
MARSQVFIRTPLARTGSLAFRDFPSDSGELHRLTSHEAPPCMESSVEINMIFVNGEAQRLASRGTREYFKQLLTV